MLCVEADGCCLPPALVGPGEELQVVSGAPTPTRNAPQTSVVAPYPVEVTMTENLRYIGDGVYASLMDAG